MKINRRYIERNRGVDRPSHSDYNEAHYFLIQVNKSTILTQEEKAELRHDALHGKLDEARKRMGDYVYERIGLV